jgi:hypothetical protein
VTVSSSIRAREEHDVEQCHLSIGSGGQNATTLIADCLGMETRHQKHRDEDECRRRKALTVNF